MVSVYHFWTIVLAIAGMVLTSSASNRRVKMWYVSWRSRIEDQSANPETESPAVYVVHRALCVLISTFAVSASSLFYVPMC